MHKVITLSLILFLSSVTWAQKVAVMEGVTTPKAHEFVTYPAPPKLDIDDEMLPPSTDYYIFEHCAVGREEILIQAQAEQERPAVKGAAVKAIPHQYKIKNYRPVRRCKDYIGTNTPIDRRNMRWAAERELYVPNRQGPIEIRMSTPTTPELLVSALIASK